jgi:hypothetical protein
VDESLHYASSEHEDLLPAKWGDIMTSLQKSLELKIEHLVRQKIEPILFVMRKICKDLKKMNDNLSQIQELLDKKFALDQPKI